jgi:polyhydroxybutyrate depolymerase
MRPTFARAAGSSPLTTDDPRGKGHPMYSKELMTRTLAVAAMAVAALLAAPRGAPANPACATQGAAGTAYDVGVNCRTVELDGVDRRYVVYVPSPRPQRAPVVLMFHGSSGTGEQFLRTSGWREQADRTGLIAVFPTGLRYRVLESGRRVTKWNDFSLAGDVDLNELPPGYPPGSPMPANDVGFVDLVMEDLDAGLPIDRHRVYASGFSNGAEFAARLSVDRARRLAAAAYSGGGMTDVRSPARPVPTYVTAGTRDARILEGTGLAELPLNPVDILTSPVVRPFIDLHLQTLGLDPDLFAAVARPRTTNLRWPGTGSAVLRFGMVGGMRHTYPDQLVPEFWRFFRSHPLP